MADSEVRQKFEAWAGTIKFITPYLWTAVFVDGNYGNQLLKAAWMAYQAGMRAGEIARWIPVEERMPDYGSISLVRVYESAEFSYTDIATYSYHGGWNVGADGSPKHVKVTLWQPLPAAPEEKK